MIDFIKKYKAFGIGILFTLFLFTVLSHIGILKIPKNSPIEVTLIFSFWSIVFSLLIHYFRYLKREKKTLFTILGLSVLFFITMFIDSKMNMPDNPITFVLLLSFWIGLAYLLAPRFIKKYKILIAVFYGPLYLYFMYMRLSSENLEVYLAYKDRFPMVIFFLPIPILFGLWIYEQWKLVKTLKNEKAKTELALLKTQINPHFFFNTLNNLYALTIKNSKQAPEVILKLSDMMRYTIYEGKKDEVLLKEEITYLENYIELHRIRYHKDVDIQFTQNILGSETISPLLFIVLLENALKHGVETLTEDAYIHMHLESTEEELHFTITNNFDPNEVSPNKGIGLENLKQRLSLTYSNSHQLLLKQEENTFTADLKITSHD